MNRYPSSAKPGVWDFSNGSVAAYVEEIAEGHPVHSDHPDLVGAAYLKSIYRLEGAGAGRASDVLRKVTEWADEEGRILVLHVRPWGPQYLTHGQLEAWYRRNGFQGFYGRMIRQPRRT